MYLTPQDPDMVADATPSDGAGAPEIEVTPEMIEAGALAWAKGDPEFDSPEAIAEKIFRAMIAAKPRRIDWSNVVVPPRLVMEVAPLAHPTRLPSEKRVLERLAQRSRERARLDPDCQRD